MKVFVWNDVFSGYQRGLGVAIAHDSEEARDLVAKELGYRAEGLANRPREYDMTEAVGFFGGGG